MRTEVIEAWPGPGSEPWWWKECSPGMRRVYLKTPKARSDRRLEKEREKSPLYIRLGEAPQGGRSAIISNTRRGRHEKGVSVFRARRAPDGAFVVDVSKSRQQLGMLKLLLFEGRPVYLATGEEVGEGSDGEPVLANVTLEPLPEGSLVRCSGEWRDTESMFYALAHQVTGGGECEVARWFQKPLEDTRVVPPPSPGKAAPTDAPSLLAAVLARSTSKNSPLRGEGHWKEVAVAGAALCDAGEDADGLLVLLFAILHDSMRLYNGLDRWHGWRGAKLARDLLGGGGLISEERLDVLAFAIEKHDAGETSADPTVGACWDADRLNVWRIAAEHEAKAMRLFEPETREDLGDRGEGER